MGGSQSTEEKSEPVDIIQPPTETRNEGPGDINKVLNAVAAQVYDNVHEQLGELQKNQVDKTTKMAKEIKERLEPVAAYSGGKAVCDGEIKSVIECLQGKNALLACDAQIDKLKRCASTAATMP